MSIKRNNALLNPFKILMKSKWELKLLLIVFIISLAFRIFYLNSSFPGLYIDELNFLLSAFIQINHLHSSLVPSYNFHDYIFYSLNGYFLSIILFKTTPFAARFPMALFGSLIVFPLYYLTEMLMMNKKISLLAAFLWAISPSAIVTSRVGTSVEIFPLFLYLLFLSSYVKFLLGGKKKDLTIAIIIIGILIFFPPLGVWADIPVLGFITYSLFPLIRRRLIFQKRPINFLDYSVSIIVANVVIWAALLFVPELLSKVGISGVLFDEPSNAILVYQPFLTSVKDFFVRLLVALSPSKLFWLSEFTNQGLNYNSSVLTPYMLSFEIPFFFASVIGIPLIYRKNWKIMRAYYYILGLSLFGLLTPLFQLYTPDYYFEPSEGIFSLPFYSILVAFSLYLFVNWIYGVLKKDYRDEPLKSEPKMLCKILARREKKAITATLLVILILFAGINLGSYLDDLYINTPIHYENTPDNLYFMFYGWDQVANFLVASHLYNSTIYYNPMEVGYAYYNTSNITYFNFWFYTMHYPLNYLYTYSSGKITSVYPLFSGPPPISSKNITIVLTQNSSYYKVLQDNGIAYKNLYTVYRADGSVAIEIIKIYKPLNQSKINFITVNKGYYDLLTGKVTGIVSETHNSKTPISFLEKSHSSYLKEREMRLMPNNPEYR